MGPQYVLSLPAGALINVMNIVSSPIHRYESLSAPSHRTHDLPGNGRIGRIIAAAAAKHLTPTTLELGGVPSLAPDETCLLTRLQVRTQSWSIRRWTST